MMRGVWLFLCCLLAGFPRFCLGGVVAAAGGKLERGREGGKKEGVGLGWEVMIGSEDFGGMRGV